MTTSKTLTHSVYTTKRWNNVWALDWKIIKVHLTKTNWNKGVIYLNSDVYIYEGGVGSLASKMAYPKN